MKFAPIIACGMIAAVIFMRDWQGRSIAIAFVVNAWSIAAIEQKEWPIGGLVTMFERRAPVAWFGFKLALQLAFFVLAFMLASHFGITQKFLDWVFR